MPDRKAAAVAHLTERGVNFAVWRGFHGRTWGLETTLEYDAGKRISPGHVGLNLGHWSLWNHLTHAMSESMTDARTGRRYHAEPRACVVVLEDDAVLPPDWDAHLESVLRNLAAHEPDWQLCFVGLSETEPNCWTKITERVGPPESKLCRMAEPFGSHAYLVRRSALPVLLDRMTAAERNMDQQLYRRVLKDNHIVWAAVLPVLVRQRTFDYAHVGRPEWSASTLDPDQVATAYRVGVDDLINHAESPGRPSAERVAMTTAFTDPYPCLYRGEFLDDAGRDFRSGRTVPLSMCARLNVPCHNRAGVKSVELPFELGVQFGRTLSERCECCHLRTEMTTDAARSRLPLPEGHFNPSMAVYDGRLVLATRDSWGHSKVALWDLRNADPGWTGGWSVTPIGSFASEHPDAPRLEDPRLYVAKHPGTGRWVLHAAFNLPDNYPPKHVNVGFARFAPDLSGIDGTQVFASPVASLYEKNWVPVVAPDGGVRWVYATKPEHVVMFDYATYRTPNPLPWTGGAVRGGATPVLAVDGRPDKSVPVGKDKFVYYHFFHGCLKRVQGSVYTIGCAVFDADPPYRVLRQTPTPLIWPTNPAPDENVVKRYVVFPGGAVPHAGAWHVVSGVDDTYARIDRIPFDVVESALSDVPESDAMRVTSIRDTAICTGIPEGV